MFSAATTAAAWVDFSTRPEVKLSHRYPRIFGSNFSTTCFRFLRRSHQRPMKMIVSVRSSVVPGGVPLPPPPPSSGGANSLPSWKKWVVGVVLSILLPSCRYKLWSLFKDRVDTAVETVEMITDIVEDVAEQVEKLADDIGNGLPEGKLKDALERLEEAADRLDKSAELAGDVIDKVQKVGEDVDSFIKSSVQVRKPSVVHPTQSADVSQP